MEEWLEECKLDNSFARPAYDLFSAGSAFSVLYNCGLLDNPTPQYNCKLEQFVFLHGNPNEIYTNNEIEFILNQGEVFVYSDYYKRTHKTTVACRIFAIKTNDGDSLFDTIAISKIINKASDCFNICFIFTSSAMYVSFSSFGDANDKKYYLSNPIKTYDDFEELSSTLLYLPENNSFADYFQFLRDNIPLKEETSNPSLTNRYFDRWKENEIEEYFIIQECLNIDVSEQIDRIRLLEPEIQQTFYEEVQECEERMFRIESNRINTMEMLFDAEEVERLSYKQESENEAIVMQHEFEEVDDSTEDLMKYIDDPEMIVKLLKSKRDNR